MTYKYIDCGVSMSDKVNNVQVLPLFFVHKQIELVGEVFALSDVSFHVLMCGKQIKLLCLPVSLISF